MKNGSDDDPWRAALWLAEDLAAGGRRGNLVAKKRRRLLAAAAGSPVLCGAAAGDTMSCSVAAALHAAALERDLVDGEADAYPASVTLAARSEMIEAHGSVKAALKAVAARCRPMVGQPDGTRSEEDLRLEIIRLHLGHNQSHRRLY